MPEVTVRLIQSQWRERNQCAQERNSAPLLPRPAFRVTRPLAAGMNTIVHSLGLTLPYAVIVQARNATTGEEVPLRAYGETANTVILQVAVSVPSAQLTVIG